MSAGFSAEQFDEHARGATLRATAPEHLQELLDAVRAATLAHELHPTLGPDDSAAPAWWGRVAGAYRSLVDEVPTLPAQARPPAAERDLDRGVSR